MDSIDLSASSRSTTGKGANRKLRRAGQIPAVVYTSGGLATSVSVDPATLEHGFAKTKNPSTLVNLAVGDSTRICLVKAVQRHPVSKVLRHVDFYEVHPDDDIMVVVKVVPVGVAAGVKAGGVMRLVRRSLDIVCKPKDIPRTIDIDVSAFEIGTVLKVSQLSLPTGCAVKGGGEFNMLTVLGKRLEAAGAAT